MIRLWHPLRDPYHCSYRLLTLLYFKGESVSTAKLSLLDLFYLFPPYMRELSLHGFSEIRKKFSDLKIPTKNDVYFNLPDKRAVYRELQLYQRVALNGLVAKEILLKQEFDRKNAAINLKALPVSMEKRMSGTIKVERERLGLLMNDVAAIPIDGPNGLMRRANLELGGTI